MNERNQKPDTHVDSLTGVGSAIGLAWDLDRKLHDMAHDSGGFCESFLCCDINNLSRYVDSHGFPESDAAITELADCLTQHSDQVYRIGGDDFVAWGLGKLIDQPLLQRDLTVRQTIVNVTLKLDKDRLHRCHSWIMAYLRLGIVQPKMDGGVITCTTPDEWQGEDRGG